MPSAVIRSFEYSEDSHELTIVFQTGRSYVYSSVPPETFAGLRQSHARGEFFNKHIRDNYRARLLNPAGPPTGDLFDT